MSNPEVLALAAKVITSKVTKEIHITLECDCEMIFAPLVSDIDKAIVGKPCPQHEHLM